MNNLKILLLTLIITFGFGLLAINNSYADEVRPVSTLYNSDQSTSVKPLQNQLGAGCKTTVNSAGQKITVCEKGIPEKIDTVSGTTIKPTTEKRELCKVITSETGQKKIFCADQTENIKDLIKPLPNQAQNEIRRVLPIFEKKEITNIDGENANNGDKPLLKRNQERVEARKIEIHDFQDRLENYKENLKENRETLNQEFKEKRETLKEEIKALGENGLMEIAQNDEKRRIITELQIEQLQLRIMTNFERMANLGNRLADIVNRIQERIEIINSTSEKDTSKATGLIIEAQNLLQILDNQISESTSSLSDSDTTLESLKETGQNNLTEIKSTLLKTKEKIRETIQALK